MRNKLHEEGAKMQETRAEKQETYLRQAGETLLVVI